MMNRRAFILAGLPAVLAAGCGFRLRGINVIPFDRVYVEGGDSPLARQLREQLADQNRLAKNPGDAAIVIVVSAYKAEKSILSLAGTGKVREYRISETAQVGARGRDGTVLLEPATLYAQRDFTYSDVQVLAKEQEEAALRRDMGLEMARQVFTRVATLKP